MSATTDLLDRWKDFQQLPSDYGAAKKLEVSRAAISNWRSGATMDEATVLRIARDLGIDELAALAQVALDRPLSARDRSIWERYRARVPVAILVAIAVTAPMSQPVADSYRGVNHSTFDNLYIMRRLDWFQRFIAKLQFALRRCRIQWLRPLPTPAA